MNAIPDGWCVHEPHHPPYKCRHCEGRTALYKHNGRVVIVCPKCDDTERWPYASDTRRRG